MATEATSFSRGCARNRKFFFLLKFMITIQEINDQKEISHTSSEYQPRIIIICEEVEILFLASKTRQDIDVYNYRQCHCLSFQMKQQQN
jgi:hypothetical protein